MIQLRPLLVGAFILAQGVAAFAQTTATASPTETTTSAAPAAPTATKSPARPAPKPEVSDETKKDDEVVTLNAFEVHADTSDSYGALESNSITRFRTDLETLPVDASIFTKTFMDDVAATSIEDMLIEYTGAYAGSSDPSANGVAGEAGDRQGSAEFTVGGLRLSVRRDGFVAMSVNTRGPVGATDSFSTERAEVIHGPQSLLYGGAGAGGIANIVSKQAYFRQRRGYVRHAIDQYGSKRTEFDYNVGTKNIAARVALLRTDKATYRWNIDGKADGAYAQLAFRLPHSTLLRVWGQSVDAKAINSTRLGNVDAFLPAGDPRRGSNPRFLIARGQADDIHIGATPINFGTVDSFGSWWASDYVKDKFAGASLETVVTKWLSTQLAVIYEDTMSIQNAPSKTILASGPAGTPFVGEPTEQLTMSGNTSSFQPTRKKAIRYSMLIEKGFFGNRYNTQTIIGVEAVSQHGGNYNSGYFKADSNWVVDTSGAASSYGRTALPTQYFSLANGIPRYPVFEPASNRVTINGQNYVLQTLRVPNPALATQLNPLGLVNGTGTYTNSGIVTRAYYLAHVASFFNNRVKFLGGARYDEQSGSQQGITSTGLKNAIYSKDKLSYNLGLNFTLRPRLNLFVSQSTAFDPDTSTSDPYGNPLRSSVSHGLQAGLRYSTEDHKISTSATYQSAVGTNQTQLIDQTWLDAINPNGINGRYAAFAGSDRWVNVDRKSDSLRLQIDANPTRSWRATLQGTFAKARVVSDGIFAQLYNDQFHTNSAGQVTYADGTPLLVGTTPLTLATINDPKSPYYANPDPDSGRITNSALTGLLTASTTHGTAATGASGLPITAMQYNWSDPYGHQGVLSPVAGSQYSPGPQLVLSFINRYTFSDGALKGLGIGTGVSKAWHNYAYYYTAGGTSATRGVRVPFIMPTPASLEYSVSYSRKIRRGFVFKTQLNVKNALNHYYYIIVPTASNGSYVNARLINTPRTFIWTNTLSF
jgi:outer membrane receptor protein involved in Fe transport